MPTEYEGLKKISEWDLKQIQQEALLEGKALLLTSVTALGGMIVSCVIALNSEGNTDLAAKTAAAVSVLASVCTFIMADQAGDLAKDIANELSSRRKTS